MQLLKEKTKTYHDTIEQNPYATALFAQKFDNSALIPYLVKFWGFHKPMEEILGAFKEWELYNFDFGRRRKLHLLYTDLLALGLDEQQIAKIPICTSLPQIQTFPQALGAMYVLEGSTLGGRVILRQMQKVAEKESAYFNSYGELTPLMWKEFCSLLSLYSQDHEQEILSAAIQTYEKLNAWMNF
ncbi:MAG: biliverdin-producing heme oxygenase [Bacteroidia bacterium]|nr:biliverdin-producing heme oxygenase [Bacteroidia bacterium]MDW8159185.1 biliverdin-producing heme oxygenase [Bacteroidia bacterium]